MLYQIPKSERSIFQIFYSLPIVAVERLFKEERNDWICTKRMVLTGRQCQEWVAKFPSSCWRCTFWKAVGINWYKATFNSTPDSWEIKVIESDRSWSSESQSRKRPSPSPQKRRNGFPKNYISKFCWLYVQVRPEQIHNLGNSNEPHVRFAIYNAHYIILCNKIDLMLMVAFCWNLLLK